MEWRLGEGYWKVRRKESGAVDDAEIFFKQQLTCTAICRTLSV